MDFDVIVAGAGPAGSSTAKFLADTGARVALVDAARPPRPKPCGGWINVQAIRRFPFLDAVRRRAGAVAFRQLLFHSPDFTRTAQFSKRAHLGYVVRRERFDAELARAAKAAGATCLFGHAVEAVACGEHGVAVGLEGGRRLEGRLLVGADGVHSTVARLTGLRTRWGDGALVQCLVRSVRLTAKERTACFSGGQVHVALGFGGASGYAWAFPGKDTVSVGVGVRQPREGTLAPLYRRWIAGMQAKGCLPPGCEAEPPEAAAVPAGAAIEFENHVGKRTLLVGDAGGFASAASGEGIYPAIRSAALAAECLQKALAADVGKTRGATCQDVLATFRSLWRQDLASYLQMPNTNVAFLLPLIFSNQEIADRFGRALLFGENL